MNAFFQVGRYLKKANNYDIRTVSVDDILRSSWLILNGYQATDITTYFLSVFDHFEACLFIKKEALAQVFSHEF